MKKIDIIKNIYNELLNNKVIKMKDYKSGIWGTITYGYSERDSYKLGKDTYYFYWECFGSSANRPTLKELVWLVNHIFSYKNIKNIEYKVEVK